MKTLDELIDEHCELFSNGAEAHQSFLAGEYVGIEHKYYALEASIRGKMLDLEAQIELLTNNEPESHE